MKKSEYLKYAHELRSTDKVEFPKRSELIAFVAKVVSDDYLNYLNVSMTLASTAAESDEWKRRQEWEPSLVSRYVYSYLEQYVVPSEDWWFCLKKKLSKKPQYKVIIDTDSNQKMYKFILERLHQGGTPEEVFANTKQYVIIDDVKLELHHI